MGASRESFSLKTDLKYKRYNRFIKNILVLFFIRRSHPNWRYERKLIIKDTFITPFNKKIGCKLFGHNWKLDEEDNYYICWNCFKYEDYETHKVSDRNEKIDKLLK